MTRHYHLCEGILLTAEVAALRLFLCAQHGT
nr:MAG TPA: hypothetical protein [Caudoviricetes sp.]